MLARVQAQLAAERAARVAAEQALATWQQRALCDKVASIHTRFDAAQHIDDLAAELDDAPSYASTNGQSTTEQPTRQQSHDSDVAARLARTEAALRNVERVLHEATTTHTDKAALLEELRSCVYAHERALAAQASRVVHRVEANTSTTTNTAPHRARTSRTLHRALCGAGVAVGIAGGVALRLALRRSRQAS